MITVWYREIGTGFSQSVVPVSIFSCVSQAGGLFSFNRGKLVKNLKLVKEAHQDSDTVFYSLIWDLQNEWFFLRAVRQRTHCSLLNFSLSPSHYFLSDLTGNVLPQTPSYSEFPRNRNWLLSVGRPSFYFLLCLSGRCGSVSIFDKEITCCITIS